MSHRPLVVAASCAAVIVLGVVAWAILDGGRRPAPQGGGDPSGSAPRVPGGTWGSTAYGGAGGASRIAGATGPAGSAGSPAVALGEEGGGGRPDASRRRAARGPGGPGEAGGSGKRGGSGSSAGGGEGSESGAGSEAEDRSTGNLLRGAHLTAAIAAALEENDLGALQGILITSLTKEGTQFSAEDVGMLFDALATSDDFGMEKLILTHLERIDAPAADKALGYAEYLMGSRRPAHADEVFGELVRMGAEASFGPLSDVYTEAPNDRLRQQALRALGDLGDPRAVPLLNQGLYGAPDAAAARPYVDALARLGGPQALGSLVDYVSREGNEASVSALRGIEDKDAAPLLADALNQRSSTAYQRAALGKLRTLPDSRALDDLARFLDRTSGPIARETIDAVSRIQDPAAVRALERYAAQAADPALATFAARSASRLRTRLESPAPSAPKPRA